MKAGGLTKLEYKFKSAEDTIVVEDIKVEESHNKNNSEVKNTAYSDVLNDKVPTNFMAL